MAVKILKSKYNRKRSWQTILKTFAGLLFLLVPSLIIWFAMVNLQTQIRNERIKLEKPKLQRLVDNSEPIFNPFVKIVHEMKENHELFTNRSKIHLMTLKGTLHQEMSFFARRLFPKLGYPLQTSICLRNLQTGSETINFANDKQVISNSLTHLTQMMYEINSKSGLDRKVEKKKILELGKEFKKLGLVFIDRPFLTGGEYSFSRHIMRHQNKLEFLISIRNKGYFMVNILLDMTSLGESSQILQKLNNFNEDNSGLAFFSEQKNKLQLFRSSWFNNHTGLLIRALKKIPNLPPKVNSFEIDNYLFLVSTPRAQSNFRTLACTELPKLEREEELQLLLAIVIICSLFLAKTFIESLIFRRYPKVSIKTFILSLFMIVCLLPLVGAVYLASEHVTNMFKLGINKTSNQIENFNTALDLETLDNFRSTLHFFKSLNSVEKLQKFAESYHDKDFGELIIKTLNKFQLREKIARSRCKLSEIWVFDTSERLRCYEFSSDRGIYRQATQVDPFLSDLFKQKFKDYLKSHKLITQKSQDQEGIEIDSLKTELLNEIFLNFFGPDAYFDHKKDIGHLLQLKSFNDRNFFYSMPVTENGEIKYILSYIFDSHSLRSHFPTEELSISNDSCSFLLFGMAERLVVSPQQMDFYANRFPEALKVAQECHLNRLKVQQQIITEKKNQIIIAQPAQFSDYIITGMRNAPNLRELKSSLVEEVARLTSLILTFMAFLALVVARYFQSPIDELTRATGEIIKENYEVRINSWHPDEFSEIATTFNHMARQLQEGKLLSTFVAQSLASELDTRPAKAQRKEASVIFSGITSFKANSRNMSPQEVFDLMQLHLVIASEAAQEFSGEIDKMIEDKVMIVFEDLNDEQTSNQRAVLAARRLAENFVVKSGYHLSIGINTGEVISGVMGSEKVRLAKTVVGDPVNLAARLAAIAEKQRGGTIVSAQTLAGLSKPPRVEKLSISTVKGKTQSVEIFAIVEEKI